MSGEEQTRKSWCYPGDKLNRNLLGRTSGLSKAGVERFLAGPPYPQASHVGKLAAEIARTRCHVTTPVFLRA